MTTLGLQIESEDESKDFTDYRMEQTNVQR